MSIFVTCLKLAKQLSRCFRLSQCRYNTFRFALFARWIYLNWRISFYINDFIVYLPAPAETRATLCSNKKSALIPRLNLEQIEKENIHK